MIFIIIEINSFGQTNYKSIASVVCQCNQIAYTGNDNTILYYKIEKRDEEDYYNNINLNLISRIGGSWVHTKSIIIDSNYDYYEIIDSTFQLVNINGLEYYYSIIECANGGTANNGFNTYQFVFYNIENDSLIILKHTRISGQPTGYYYTQDQTSLIKYKDFISISQKFIVKKFGIDNFDIDDEANFSTKWYLKNEDIFENLENYKKYGILLENYSINIIEYDNEFFNNILNKFKPQESDILNNSKYIAFSTFMSPVIIYSKERKKSYVVFVPDGYGEGGAWGMRSFKITDLNNDILTFKDSEFKLEIDLKNGKVKNIEIIEKPIINTNEEYNSGFKW